MNFDPNEPMDNHLLQLERELFSLTPVEAPRRFASQLEREVGLPAGPVAVARSTSPQHRIIVPFRWQRIVVPAAAAVVVVSVLNRQGGAYAPNSLEAATNQASAAPKPVMSSPASVALRSRQMNTGYMMMTEQSPLQNVNWSNNPNQYWVNPETHYSSTPLVLPRRETVPVSFH